MKRGAGGLGGSGPTPHNLPPSTYLGAEEPTAPQARSLLFWYFIPVGLISAFIPGGLIAPPPFEKKNRRPFRATFIFD